VACYVTATVALLKASAVRQTVDLPLDLAGAAPEPR
jgi:hypothetical protein